MRRRRKAARIALFLTLDLVGSILLGLAVYVFDLPFFLALLALAGFAVGMLGLGGFEKEGNGLVWTGRSGGPYTAGFGGGCGGGGGGCGGGCGGCGGG